MILYFGPHTDSNYSNFVALSYQTPCADPRLQGCPPAEFRSESSSILSPHRIGLPSAILGVIALSLPARPELRSPWLPQATLGSNTPAGSPQLAHPPSPPPSTHPFPTPSLSLRRNCARHEGSVPFQASAAACPSRLAHPPPRYAPSPPSLRALSCPCCLRARPEPPGETLMPTQQITSPPQPPPPPMRSPPMR